MYVCGDVRAFAVLVMKLQTLSNQEELHGKTKNKKKKKKR